MALAANLRIFVWGFGISSSCRTWRSLGTTTALYSTTSSSSSSSSPAPPSPKKQQPQQNLSVKEKRQKAREKRKEFIGMAKAVDRGQFTHCYEPGGPDGSAFEAKSGLPNMTRPFTVLGIETSCDDTGGMLCMCENHSHCCFFPISLFLLAAVVRSDGVILGEALASQKDIHEEWGGVVPGLARDAHAEQIDGIVQEALRNAGMDSLQDVDAIGVTVGPGLEICLRVGCNKAREWATQYSKPFVAVHHLEAHVLMARMPGLQATSTTASSSPMEFPFLALLVSGGHCQILKCLGIGKYTMIGGTMDDSLGEAFDKTARLLGLPVGGGGGPAVERLAREGNRTAVLLSVPLQRRKKDCDFSYAGLKTGVRLAAEKLASKRGLESVSQLHRRDKADVAASFQHVAIRHVEERLERAMKRCEEEDGIRTLAVVGGVAANRELRTRLDQICEKRGWDMFVPPPRLCTDQGAMSAWAAIERIAIGSTDTPENQEVFARYPFSIQKQNAREGE
eukprot:CAMPEP_0116843756 /NCGR_PEP_ID=MMETSP0418-20121206/12270_1 /TAXON_ID=1158023 /ORGANISM="Astrosyne radiata, Strain 13vi08-1A" /LENGTH=506 /DNA_ID=CAMNT_0004474555 /DNA_START=121 /DNA_END=1641 /DNA_ORIENTATION=+